MLSVYSGRKKLQYSGGPLPTVFIIFLMLKEGVYEDINGKAERKPNSQ